MCPLVCRDLWPHTTVSFADRQDWQQFQLKFTLLSFQGNTTHPVIASIIFILYTILSRFTTSVRIFTVNNLGLFYFNLYPESTTTCSDKTTGVEQQESTSK